MYAARSRSWCEGTSASAGASRKVGANSRDSRIGTQDTGWVREFYEGRALARMRWPRLVSTTGGSRDSRLGLGSALTGHLLRLGHQDLDDLLLRDPVLLHLAAHDELPVPLARGDPEVCLPGLARAVHHAAHHGHADGRLEPLLLEGLVHLLGEAQDVHLGPAAGRTGHQVQPPLLQSKRLQDPR